MWRGLQVGGPFLVGLSACTLLADLHGFSSGAPASDASLPDAAPAVYDASVSEAAGKAEGDARANCGGSSFCDDFERSGDGALQGTWTRAQTLDGGALALFSPGASSAGALRVELSAMTGGAEGYASMVKLLGPTLELTLDFDVFVEELPARGSLALGNIQILGTGTYAAMDFYIGPTSSRLYHSVTDVFDAREGSFTPERGVWTHVRQEISIPNNRISVVLDGKPERSISVFRDLSSVVPKSGFLLIGLSHYAGQEAAGHSAVRVDNVVVNAPAL